MVFTKQGKQNVSFSSLSTVLNNHSKDIFEFGLENIEDLTQNKNIWRRKGQKNWLRFSVLLKAMRI